MEINERNENECYISQSAKVTEHKTKKLQLKSIEYTKQHSMAYRPARELYVCPFCCKCIYIYIISTFVTSCDSQQQTMYLKKKEKTRTNTSTKHCVEWCDFYGAQILKLQIYQDEREKKLWVRKMWKHHDIVES